MSIPQKPRITRLRFVTAKDAETLVQFCNRLGVRIQIYDIEFAKGKWYLWFVPDDFKDDIQSGDLD